MMECPRWVQSVAREMPVDPDVPSITIPPVRVEEMAVVIVVWIVVFCDVLSSFDANESSVVPLFVVVTPPSPLPSE